MTDAPVIGYASRFHAVPSCPGSFRVTDQSDAVWIARCDECDEQVGVPARELDPAVRRAARRAAAYLPDSFAGRHIDRTPEREPVLRSLRQWLAGYDPSLGAASLLPAPCIWGDTGRGKSCILTATCERVIDELDLAVAWCSTRSLLHDLQRFDSDTIRGAAWDRAASVDVLALDDLGAERPTDWRIDQLAHLIDERYQSERPILIATNYSPNDWPQILDARTVSRLRQMVFPIELSGPDRRLGEAA